MSSRRSYAGAFLSGGGGGLTGGPGSSGSSGSSDSSGSSGSSGSNGTGGSSGADVSNGSSGSGGAVGGAEPSDDPGQGSTTPAPAEKRQFEHDDDLVPGDLVIDEAMEDGLVEGMDFVIKNGKKIRTSQVSPSSQPSNPV